MKKGAFLIAIISVCLHPSAFSSDAMKQQEGIKAVEDAVAHTNCAIKEWRYEPAACNGKPVELETVIRVDYSLRR
jgi:hypothetical protein